MSQTFCFRPVSPTETQTIGYATPSATREALEKAFERTLPFVLSVNDIPILRGMGAASRNDFYTSLIEEIEKYGAVELWTEV